VITRRSSSAFARAPRAALRDAMSSAIVSSAPPDARVPPRARATRGHHRSARRAVRVVVTASRTSLEYAPNDDVSSSALQTTASSAPRPPTFSLTPAQRGAFTIGVILGTPLALYKIALDVRAQNVAERKRAKARADKARATNALAGRRDGLLRAEAVGRRAEARARTNVGDIPIASNKKRELVIAQKESGAGATRAGATRAGATTPATGVSGTPVKPPKVTPPRVPAKTAQMKKLVKPVNITLATQATVPEGFSLCVVGNDEAVAQPVELKRVGQDRWQVVLKISTAELRYSYVASNGKSTIQEKKGERARKIDEKANPLIIESESPIFSV